MGSAPHLASGLPLWRTRHLARAAGIVATVLVLSGCGSTPNAHGSPTSTAVAAGDRSGFDAVVAAVQASAISFCAAPEGGPFVALPAPPTEAAATAAYFRYAEGRIYQFAPCDVSPERRNELRIFRYTGAAVRDEAIRAMAARTSRPTAAFAIGDAFEAEIWSPDPSLEDPVGRSAAAVHSAIGRLDGARHLDVDP